MFRSRQPIDPFTQSSFSHSSFGHPSFARPPLAQPFATTAAPGTFIPRPQQEEVDFAALMAALRERAARYRAQAPGFFTPYRSGADFGRTLIAPVAAPLALGLLTAVSAAAAAIAAAVCVGSLLVAGVSALVGAKRVKDASLNLALISGVIAGVTTLLTPLLAVAAAVSLPATIVALVTRSGATTVDAAKKACASGEGYRRVESDEAFFRGDEGHHADDVEFPTAFAAH
ncbi:hypothetical protein [Legionella oakridgensis]|uniref:hypothetical protein n=1 Tax=Legionella oakridgensis TaxID=29423 RepID=UPI0003DE4DD0|nr:hypothetical protein [Legionella oakridgensis]ETO92437.1 hypothetical protein LOR_65c17950 [Legionella oakridgensis RV-2-2007]